MAETRKPYETPKLRQLSDLEALTLELAFAIEDPCGQDAIELARELVRLGQLIPPDRRTEVVEIIRRSVKRIVGTAS